MASKHRVYGSVRPSLERKLAPRDKQRVAQGQRRGRPERSQEEQPWWARPRRPGGT